MIVQFALSIFLIIGGLMIYRQLGFMRRFDLGYNREHLITVEMKGNSRQFYDQLKSRWLETGLVRGVSGSGDDFPHFDWGTGSMDWDGKDPALDVHVFFNPVNYDFFETAGLTMAAGRSFSREMGSDEERGVIINERLAELMNQDQTVGARFQLWGVNREVIGVVEDFNFQSLDSRIDPIMFIVDQSYMNYMLLRINGHNVSRAIEQVKKVWEETVPLYPFDFTFVDRDVERNYQTMERMSLLANTFSGLAILIACLGLFGLASFTASQRSKEIGVRKVLGSSVTGIVFLLSRDFGKCVLVANVLAWPAAWFALTAWQNQYVYKAEMGLGLFLSATGMTLFIALLTVSFQAVRTALINPVDALKYE